MKYIFANWKMYLNAEESKNLAMGLKLQTLPQGIEPAVFPTLLSFQQVQEILQGTGFSMGVQNVNWVPKGAYTGAVSALIAHSAGAKYALVGHSERRYIFGETDSDVGKKVQACQEVGLIPVVCIGETKEDLEMNKKVYRLKKQVETIFARDTIGSVMIAYEPVWAISSVKEGKACLPADADDVIGWIKQEIKQYIDVAIPVLYGGSVSVENCLEYMKMPSGDGLLIGFASTEIESFSKILQQVSVLEN